jgi:hypothetical protein
MSRTKGTEKTGGRPKGKPNKVTTELKTWISKLIANNLSQIKKDIKAIEPKDRLIIIERLMQYTIPKQQSISAEAQIKAEYDCLYELLNEAPDEAIEEITDRIININKMNDGKQERKNQ